MKNPAGGHEAQAGEVEAVARAIHNTAMSEGSACMEDEWELLEEEDRDQFRRDAKAAIDAIATLKRHQQGKLALIAADMRLAFHGAPESNLIHRNHVYGWADRIDEALDILDSAPSENPQAGEPLAWMIDMPGEPQFEAGAVKREQMLAWQAHNDSHSGRKVRIRPLYAAPQAPHPEPAAPDAEMTDAEVLRLASSYGYGGIDEAPIVLEFARALLRRIRSAP
jgi:hypothetical protein